jgi:diguanylate cyclase (GGDEF)-like protein
MAVSKKLTSYEEKLQALCLHSNDLVLIVCGALAGLVVAVIILLTQIGLSARFGGIFRAGIPFMVIACVAGGAAGKIQQAVMKRRIAGACTEGVAIPAVYLVFFVSLVFISVVWIMMPLIKGQNLAFLDSFGIAREGALSWLLLVTGVVIGSFVFASPLEHFWRFWYSLWLVGISDVDYRAVVEEEFLWSVLKLKTAEMERCPSPLSLILIEIEGLEEILRRYGHRHVREIHRQARNLIDENIRSTDIIGTLNGEKIVAVLTFCGAQTARIAVERIKQIVETHDFAVGSRRARIRLNYGLASYSGDIRSKEEFVERARFEIKRAAV